MVVSTSQFYKGIIPKELFDIRYFKEHDDFIESNLDIVYRFLYKNLKLEISFLKTTSSIHYIQIENLGNGKTCDSIVLIDDCNIFNKKISWIKGILKENEKKVQLHFDDDNKLYSLVIEYPI